MNYWSCTRAAFVWLGLCVSVLLSQVVILNQTSVQICATAAAATAGIDCTMA